ncbi:MAG TPA: hypothetical protein DC049_04075 [Spirochaetia bacterium]|nr:hypothetical protein [Spirochaetia bacterium]
MKKHREKPSILVMENDRLRIGFDLKKGCSISSFADIESGKSLLRQENQILVSGHNTGSITDAKILSVKKVKTRDLHMGSGQTVFVRLELEIDESILQIERRIDLLDHTGAVRIVDTWRSSAPLGGVWYSELGSYRFNLGRIRTSVYDWISCSDQTNHRLVTSSGSGRKCGVLFTVSGKQGGIFVWKEGPVPDSRPVKGKWDFNFHDELLSVTGTGFNSINPREERRSDGIIIGLLEDEKSLLGLRRYQKMRYFRKNYPETAEWTANSWPAFHLNVDEEKIRKELEIAAFCGFNIVTVDDGWFETFMGEVDKNKFPSGMENLSACAQRLGVKLGLWMNPLGLDVRDPRAKLWDGAECHDIRTDTRKWNWVARTPDFKPCETYISEGVRGYFSMDLCNQEYFSYLKNRLLSFAGAGIKNYKFDLYQLDAYNAMTGDEHRHYEAYRNFLDELKKAGITVEMDITRGNRPCFDFGLDYGRLFLENRGRNLKDHRWYEPWISLANLWDAARLAPSQLLELEVFPQLAEYPVDYVLSTALTASPLFFGSLADLSGEQQNKIKIFIKNTREVKIKILQGLIVPAGNRPAKDNWSGMTSLHPEGRGYFIAWRNGKNAGDKHTFNLTGLPLTGKSVQPVYGNAASAILRNKKLEITIKDDLGFSLVEIF